VSGDDNFVFSRREFFATFHRQELSYTKNLTLTVIAKFLIKYVWDCKTRFRIPEMENCWEFFCDKITFLVGNNNRFRKLWEGSGMAMNLNLNLNLNQNLNPNLNLNLNVDPDLNMIIPLVVNNP
jgi:hypothetical protein